MSCLINSENAQFLCFSHSNPAELFCCNPKCTLRLLCADCRETHARIHSEFKGVDFIHEQPRTSFSNGDEKSNIIVRIAQEAKENQKILQKNFELYDLASGKLIQKIKESENACSSLDPTQKMQQSLDIYLFEQKNSNGELGKILSLNRDIEGLFTEYNNLLQQLKTEIQKDLEPKADTDSRQTLATDNAISEIKMSKTQIVNSVGGNILKEVKCNNIADITGNLEIEFRKKLDWEQIIKAASYDQYLEQEKRKEKIYYESGMSKPELLTLIQQNIQMLEQANNIACPLRAHTKYNLKILEKLMIEIQAFLNQEHYFILSLSDKIKTLQSLNKEKEQLEYKISKLNETSDETQINLLSKEIQMLRNSSLEIEGGAFDKAEEKLKQLSFNLDATNFTNAIHKAQTEETCQTKQKRPKVKRSKKGDGKIKSLKSELKFFWGKEHIRRKSEYLSTKNKKTPPVNSLYVEHVYSRTAANSKSFPRSLRLLERIRNQLHEQENKLSELISNIQNKPSPKKFVDFVREVDSSVIIGENVDKKINEVVGMRTRLQREANLFANMTFKPSSLIEKMKEFQANRESYPIKSRGFSTVHKEIELFKEIYQALEEIKAEPGNKNCKSIEEKIAAFCEQVGKERYAKTLTKIKNELESLKNSNSGISDNIEIIEILSSESESELSNSKQNPDAERIFEEIEPIIVKKIKSNDQNSIQTTTIVHEEEKESQKENDRATTTSPAATTTNPGATGFKNKFKKLIHSFYFFNHGKNEP